MPDVRNCRRCGKVYNYLGGAPICPVCKQLDEEDFKKVKNYLYENPGATLSEVSVRLDITVEKIKRFLKEGRLEIVGGEGNLILECERCGKSIKSGRYCDACEKEVAGGFKEVAGQMNQSTASAEIQKRGTAMKYLHKEDINKK